MPKKSKRWKKSTSQNPSFINKLLYTFVLLIGLLALGFISKPSPTFLFAQSTPPSYTIKLGTFIPVTNAPPPQPTRRPPPTGGPRPTYPPITFGPTQACGIGGDPGNCCVIDGPMVNPCCPGVPPAVMPSVGPWCNAKPVIYLYPDKPSNVSVKLNIPGLIIKSDPSYPQNGWQNIYAYPDGTFSYNNQDFRELFYESAINYKNPPENGAIVLEKNSMREGINSILDNLSLKPFERNEFLSYWLPQLESLKAGYLYVSLFPEEQSKLFDEVLVSPQPNTFIKYIFYFKPLEKPVKTSKLNLPKLQERVGFTVVEWGGILDQ